MWHRRGVTAVVAAACVLSAISACQGRSEQEDRRGVDESTSPAAGSPGDHAEEQETGGSRLPSLEDPRISESSGIARSNVHDGVYYTHNDRGSPAQLFAVDHTGTRAVLDLGVTAIDWEDIASTPDGRLWVADTGDNEELRTSVSLVVVDEPDVLVSARLAATTYNLSYPDGPHDAEALLIDPRDRRVYVVTKAPERGAVYAAPAQLEGRGPNMLQRVGTAPNNITAGDFAPDGRVVVLRNQGKAFFYRHLGGTPTEVVLPPQPQGESVAFTADGAHVLLGSEGLHSNLVRLPVPRLED